MELFIVIRYTCVFQPNIRRWREGNTKPFALFYSAGCGRTGTICAIDFAWDMLKMGVRYQDLGLYAHLCKLT